MGGASLVVRDASTAHRPSAAATLFAGLSFFCVQKLPTRSQLIRDIQANGGRVVKDEKLADYLIADHARKDAPPGSYSWTLVTAAIAHGALPDLAEHYAGPRPGSVREVGSAVPGKTTRTPFTHEEDKQLWQWVEQEKARGGTVKGNDIYKRLEQVNPRHTFQSWRDRYLKKLMVSPPAGMEPAVPVNAPPSPPTAPDRDDGEEQASSPPAKRRRLETMHEQDHGPDRFEQQSEEAGHVGDHDEEETDVDRLLSLAADIEDIEEGKWLEAFEFWSRAHSHRSAREWIKLWHEKVRPMYQEQLRNETSPARGEVNPSDSKEIGRERKRQRRLAPGNGEQSIGSGSPQTCSHHVPFGSSDVDCSDRTPKAAVPAASKEPAYWPDLLTSDENRAASQQIIHESSGRCDKGARRARLPEISSDVANAPMEKGDERLKFRPNQSWKTEDSQGLESQQHLTNHEIGQTGPTRVPRHFVTERSKSPREESRAESLLAERNLEIGSMSQLPGRAALTEANLAAQEAQHKAPLLRGADLPEDDENHDQSNFVEYLQNSLKTSHIPPYFSESKGEPTSRGYAGKMRSRHDETEKELDEVTRSNMEWPSSPQQTRATGVPMEVQVEHREDQPVLVGTGITDDSPPTEVRAPRAGATMPGRELNETKPDPSDDAEHEVDLSVAFPEVGGGFDSTSDRHSSQEAGDIYGEVYEPERPAHDTPRMRAQVIEISSTSIPSSPLPDSEGQTYDWRVNRPLETQDVYNAETQLADLSMPLPHDTDDEEGDEDAAAHDLVQTIAQRASSQAVRADTPSPVLESEDEAVQLESWMTTMQVRGHDESAIIQAAKCTSLQLELAELVLMHIRGGNGVPNDVPGVWTADEDEQLEGGNARAIRLLENKHGWDACRTRLDYLEKYRDAE
ncbi:DNA-binding protein RAP1 [Cercospora zeina]